MQGGRAPTTAELEAEIRELVKTQRGRIKAIEEILEEEGPPSEAKLIRAAGIMGAAQTAGHKWVERALVWMILANKDDDIPDDLRVAME